MDITEVRIMLPREGNGGRLRAYASVTFDDGFVVRDLKVVFAHERLIVFMPQRKKTDHCPHCQGSNHLQARYCNTCGARLADDRVRQNDEGRFDLFHEVAHPINSAFRERLEAAVLSEYHRIQ